MVVSQIGHSERWVNPVLAKQGHVSSYQHSQHPVCVNDSKAELFY